VIIIKCRSNKISW